MSTIVITGGSGLIGTALTNQLTAKGHEVIILSRGIRKIETGQDMNQHKVTYASWDIEKEIIEPGIIEKADYIIHLAGAGVADKRWSEKRKKEIVESRTKSGALIVKALREKNHHVKALLCASGIGWYGPDIDVSKAFAETDPSDPGFLGETCRQWEESTAGANEINIRRVVFRIGLVFSNNGGALTEFIKPIKYAIAAILGNGRQVVSWIHMDDLCRLFLRAIEDDTIIGIYNAVTPQPITNKNLTLQLAKKMRGKFFIPIYVPAFILKILVGEMSIEVLKSTTVSCNKIKAGGFTFLYPTLEAALPSLVKK
jgi:uncharacterized protein